MAHLLNLPDDLLLFVFSEFLETKHIGMLDRVICNHRLRNDRFLKLIDQPHFVTQGIYDDSNKLKSYFNWLRARKCRVAVLKYSDEDWDISPNFSDYIFSEKITTLHTHGRHLNKTNLTSIIKSCRNVTNLNLNINDDMILEAVANNCPHLKILEFQDHCFLKDSEVSRMLFRKCQLLSNITSRIADASIVLFMAQNLPNLDTFIMLPSTTLCTDTLCAVLSKKPPLTKFTSQNCYLSSDHSMFIVDRGDFYRSTVDICRVIESRAAIATIKHLTIDCEPQCINDYVLSHMATLMPQLRTLIVINGNELTDKFIQPLTSHCPLLENIKLGRCSLLTDVGVIALIDGCMALKSIELTNCPSVSDVFVHYLIESAGILDTGAEEGSTGAVNDHIIFGGGAKLQSLKLFNIPLISSEAVELLKASRPQLSVRRS